MSFADRLIDWQRRAGRHDLPWQRRRDPYGVWVSEIMLQQTQVATVIPYYQRFLERFPSAAALAEADLDQVLQLWSGLGYYSRARHLHRAAREIVERWGGVFPKRVEDIARLPGVGRSTAAAIAVFAFGARAAILDGNVKRVLARCFGIEGYPGTPAVERQLWRQAESLLPERDVAAYTQALMDLGALVCTRARPRCEACPVAGDCVARLTGRAEQLPTPRPRRPLPLRQVQWLVVLRHDEVLLEKRPPAGLWGGLWSFPEIAVEEDATAWCERALQASAQALTPLEPFDHVFTHFALRIHPQLVRVRRVPARAAQPGWLWIPIDEAARAAVPTPVRKVLAAVGSPGP
ncbi:MAG: A/G-specific adenine glycosylase [Azospira oryzae]|nr:MAG: A/G-specific adenine glycosylase [Azospira oryzae]PZP82206.1 MAG: A/G-specific adenine glycosylase [Azospira oryzae]